MGCLLALSQTLVDRSGDVGAAVVVLVLVLLAAQSILSARSNRWTRPLGWIIVPVLVLAAAVLAFRFYWLAT